MTSLFKRARSLDPVTSHAAADQSIDLARQHFEKIVECLRRFGPRGKDGIAELTGLDGNQVARRMKELEKDGRVELTGRTIKSNSGRAEREWQFVPVQRKLI
jgi:predicted ArsR family transcriptional regulator